MELNTTDRLILAKLQEGRAKPAYLASELDRRQPYISNRLGELVEAGVVLQLYRGLYGHAALEDDPVDAEQRVKQATDEELLTGRFNPDRAPSHQQSEAMFQPSTHQETEGVVADDGNGEQVGQEAESEPTETKSLVGRAVDGMKEPPYQPSEELE